MNGVASGSRLRAVARSVARLIIWAAVVIVSLLLLSALFTLSGQMPGQTFRKSPVETFTAIAIMALSTLAIILYASRSQPGRHSWIAVHAGVIALGILMLSWLPQWSGLIVAAAFVPFVFVPYTLSARAQRHSIAGRPRRAALCWRVASWLHPSRLMRFYAAVLDAHALGSLDAEIARYAALRRTARPEELAILECCSATAREDWAGAIAHSGGASNAKWIEIHALGELGRIDDMVGTFAAALSRTRDPNLRITRLHVLAFAGRVDAVRALLRSDLRFLEADRKAYWSVVAANAAGIADEAARRALADCARASREDAFRRAALRQLSVTVPRAAVVLSANSQAWIADIERSLLGARR